METLRKVIKIGGNLENQKKQCTFAVSKKNKSINRSTWNIKNRKIMEKITFIAEFRDKTDNKRVWSTIRETTISKALKEAEKIGKANNIKLIGIREA